MTILKEKTSDDCGGIDRFSFPTHGAVQRMLVNLDYYFNGKEMITRILSQIIKPLCIQLVFYGDQSKTSN